MSSQSIWTLDPVYFLKDGESKGIAKKLVRCGQVKVPCSVVNEFFNKYRIVLHLRLNISLLVWHLKDTDLMWLYFNTRVQCPLPGHRGTMSHCHVEISTLHYLLIVCLL